MVVLIPTTNAVAAPIAPSITLGVVTNVIGTSELDDVDCNSASLCVAIEINSTTNGYVLQVAATGEVLANIFGVNNPLTALDFVTLPR